MYNYKLYERDWTFIKTLSPNIIKTDLDFSSNENAGQGEYRLNIDSSFNDTDFSNSNIIKIYKQTNLIYTGVIQDVVRKITNTYDEVSLPLLWLGSIANYLIFKDWVNFVFTKTQDPSQTIKDIIDYMNTHYNLFSYDTSIETYWTSIALDFDYTNCFEALKNTIEATDYKLYINKNGKVYFKAKPLSATHKLTVGKDIESITLEEDSETLVNKLYLKGATISSTYEDTASQTTYWIKEKRLVQSELNDTNAMDSYGNAYIDYYKNPQKITKVIVNNNYDIDTINLLDTVKIQNINYTLDNLQIVKIKYNAEKVVLDLENYKSFGKEYLN